MAVQPNAACEFFCDFVLLEIPKRLTPARLQLVQDVRTAAINVTTVSDLDWNNFVLATLHFYEPYQIYTSFKT